MRVTKNMIYSRWRKTNLTTVKTVHVKLKESILVFPNNLFLHPLLVPSPAEYPEGLHPGRCSTFHIQARTSSGLAPQRGAGVPGAWAQRPLPAPRTQHAKGHWAANEAGRAGGECVLGDFDLIFWLLILAEISIFIYCYGFNKKTILLKLLAVIIIRKNYNPFSILHTSYSFLDIKMNFPFMFYESFNV